MPPTSSTVSANVMPRLIQCSLLKRVATSVGSTFLRQLGTAAVTMSDVRASHRKAVTALWQRSVLRVSQYDHGD